MKNKKISLAVVSLLSPLLLLSQTPPAAKALDSLIQLEEIEIATTRTKSKKEALPQKIEVIGAEEIKNTGAKDLTDVLKKCAGVDVIQYPGMLSGIGIRGFRPQFSGINQRSLLLIDGRPAGSTNLAMIDLSNVERIEVMKGPSSSLYGSQAMGGVVNVITKKSKGNVKKTVSASFGSFSTLEAGFAAGGSLSEKLDFDFNIKHFQQTEDFRQGSDNLFRNTHNWDKATNTYYNNNHEVDSVKTINDKSGDGEIREYTKYNYESGGIRLGYALNDKWRTDVNTDFFSAHNVQNPGDIAYGNTSQSLKNPYRYAVNLTINGKIFSHHDLLFKTYTAIEFSDYRNVSAGVASKYITSSTKNNWIGFQLQDNMMIKKQVLIIGIDNAKAITTARSWNASDGREKAPYAPNYGIYSTAAFANANFIFFAERLTATLGGRLDHITFDVQQTPYLETFKNDKASYSVFNPSAGIKYKLTPQFNVHSTVGRAFVTPDAFAVAGYAISGPGAAPTIKGKVNVTSGNPDLKPESSISVDGGLRFVNRVMGLEADVTYFHTTVVNRITTGQSTLSKTIELTDEQDTIASRTKYINSDQSFMQGIEIGAAYNFGALADYAYSLKLFANSVSYIQLEEKIKNIKTDTYYTRKIYNVANQTLTAGLEYGNESFKAHFTGRYVSKRYDTDWNDYIKRPEIEYPSFITLDFSTSFTLKKYGEVTIQLSNITDENYYEKRGFNMPGRSLTLKYALSF